MTLPPERIGDKGQRYVVEAFGYPKAGWCRIVYTNDDFDAHECAKTILEAPSCTHSRVIDREETPDD